MPGFNIYGSGSGPSSTIEVLRSHRWNVRIYNGLSLDSPFDLYPKTITRPKRIVDNVVIHYGQEEAYKPGKTRWEPVTLVFYDTFTSNLVLSEKIEEWRKIVADGGISRLYEKNVKGVPEYSGSTRVTLELLDGSGKPMIAYTLIDAWLERVTPSDLDYSTSNLCTLEIQIRYNRAEFERFVPIEFAVPPIGGGVGQLTSVPEGGGFF